MVNIKNWKKIKARGQATDMWANSKRLEIVCIYPPEVSLSGKVWTVRTPTTTRYGLGDTTEFKTKSQAIKYAKNWMKKHPYG